MWINGHLRGSKVLGQQSTGPRNAAGTPLLLVTATRDAGYLYVEVLNRSATAVRDRVSVKGIETAGAPTLFVLADGVTPGEGKATTLGREFEYSFPALSVSVFRYPLPEIP